MKHVFYFKSERNSKIKTMVQIFANLCCLVVNFEPKCEKYYPLSAYTIRLVKTIIILSLIIYDSHFNGLDVIGLPTFIVQFMVHSVCLNSLSLAQKICSH